MSFIVLAIHTAAHHDGIHPFTCGAWNAKYVDTPNGKVKAAGSGADVFLEIFKSGALQLGNDRSDEVRFHGAMSSIMGYEFFGGNTLENWIGGPYEIAGLAQRGRDAVIIKQDNILNLFWHFDLDDPARKLQQIGFTLYQFYSSGHLLVVMRETKKDLGECTSIHSVPELFSQDTERVEASLKNMNYEAKPYRIVSNILSHRSRQYLKIVSRVELGNEATESARATLKSGHLFLELDLNFLAERIAGAVRRGEQIIK